MGRGEQDDFIFPYTINPNIAVTPLPRSTLDAEVDTMNLSFTVVSRPFAKARVKFAFRHDERDNKTAQSQWSRVITDAFPTGSAELNIPYSFERSRPEPLARTTGSSTPSGSRQAMTGHSSIAIFRRSQSRSRTPAWGKNTLAPHLIPGNHWERRCASERDIDLYDDTVAMSLGQNPLMRKYNLAYRYRRFGELTLSASHPERPVSFTINALYANDQYQRSQLGLIESEELRFAADLSWSVSEHASIYVTGGVEDIDGQQSGSELFATPNWQGQSRRHVQ